jgi:hypothetical protein
MGVAEMKKIAEWMDEVAQHPADEARITRIAGEVAEMCKAFPAPGKLTGVLKEVEREIAKKEGRAPKEIRGQGDGRYVACSVKKGAGPGCDDAAKTYVDAAKPSQPFTLVVTKQNDKAQCGGRYSADGKLIGSADAFDIPQQ